MSAHTPSAALAGRATGAMFLSFFGAAWLIAGTVRLGHATFIACVAILLGAATIFLLGLRLYGPNRSARDAAAATPRGRHLSRWFGIINTLQWIAIIATSTVLATHHLRQWIVPAIILIVGLHFFPLARLFHYLPHYLTGAALVLIAVAYPLLARAGPASSAGCLATGLVLWISALYGLYT